MMTERLGIILSKETSPVNKSTVLFSAIGAYHGIEQENKFMNILGGIKGIENNQKALNEYLLTAGEMGNIIEDFADVFQIRDSYTKENIINLLALAPKTQELQTMLTT